MLSVVTVFVSLWAIPFLVKGHHLSILQAAEVCSWFFLGAGVACPLVGWLDNHLLSRRSLMASFSVITVILMTAVLMMSGLSLNFLGGMMFCLGFFCSVYVLSYTIGHEIATPKTRGASIGIVNTFCVIMAPIFQPVVGNILDYVSHYRQGVSHYSVHSYQLSLMIIPLMMVIAVVLIFFLPKPKQEKL